MTSRRCGAPATSARKLIGSDAGQQRAAPTRPRRGRWRGPARRGRCRRSTTGGAASPRSAAARERVGLTRSSGSGAIQRNGSSGPAVRGTLRSARRMRRLERLGGVLERLALEEAGEQEVALLEAQQLLVELEVVEAGQQAAGLELHQGGGDEQELGGDVEIEPVSMRSSSVR